MILSFLICVGDVAFHLQKDDFDGVDYHFKFDVCQMLEDNTFDNFGDRKDAYWSILRIEFLEFLLLV